MAVLFGSCCQRLEHGREEGKGGADLDLTPLQYLPPQCLSEALNVEDPAKRERGMLAADVGGDVIRKYHDTVGD